MGCEWWAGEGAREGRGGKENWRDGVRRRTQRIEEAAKAGE
jgi:hypothetical protein